MLNIIKSLRPNHWVKNLLIFAALVFSENLFNLSLFLKTLFGFGVFCLLASGLYILNDIVDINKDKLMPKEFQRPIAKGLVEIHIARPISSILIVASLVLSFILNLHFGFLSIIYCALMVSYTLYFKNLIFLDVIIISMGFVIRAIAGAILINIDASNWLIFCTFFLALFISTIKRRSRLCFLRLAADKFNNIYRGYDLEILNWMIQIFASITIVSYALYVVSLREAWKGMFFTIPIVVHCVLRYFYENLITKQHILPEELIFKNKPILISIILWFFIVIIVVYLKS